MKEEAYCKARVTPMRLVRRILGNRMRYDWSPECTERWFYLLNVCDVRAARDLSLGTISLEEAERLSAALEPEDLDCEDPSDPVELRRIETEMQVAFALARKIGPNAKLAAIQVFPHLDSVRKTTGADASAIRNIAKHIGALIADAVMRNHRIPLDESGISTEETMRRERVFESLIGHVANEIRAGN